jgi:hypothetical protein
MITRSKVKMEKQDGISDTLYVEHIKELHNAAFILLDDLDKLEREKLRRIITQYENLIKNLLDIE